MMWQLGEVATVLTGYPFRSRVGSEPGGDLVLVQIKDVDENRQVQPIGGIRLHSVGRRFDRYLLRRGDLLMQARGTRHPVAIVADGLRGVPATGLLVIRCRVEQVLPEYLVCWLNLAQTQARLSADLARGTYIPFISKGDLEAFPVPVPPLGVQAQLAEVDRLRRTERQLLEALSRLQAQRVEGSITAAATGHA